PEVLKVINKALLDRPGAVERFLREIRSAAKLNHVNVVAAHCALQLGELLVFAMEYVEGQDLAAVVKANGPLPVAHACFYVQQAAQGLQHAFEKKMVHRDIKPQNLMLARDGRKHLVKVLDFGLAKVMREKTEDTGLTGEGKMLGTPDYMAPEQTLDATSADIRADIYSLGCTLYFLLSGTRPFKGKSLYDIMQAHQSLEAPALNVVRPEVPAELAAVVRKMMAKDRGQRYQTPLEVVQALSPFIKQAPSKSSPGLSVAGTTAASAPAVKAERPSLPSTPGKQPQSLPAPPPPVAWDSLTDSVLAGTRPRTSGAVIQRRSTAGESASWKRWLMAGGVAACLLLLGWLSYWLAVVLLRVETPNGTLIVEMNDKDVEARIKDGKLILTGSDGKVRYTLSPNDRRKQLEVGSYKIRVEGADGLVLDTTAFTIKKGGEVKVRVKMEPKAVAKKGPAGLNPDRKPDDKGFVS
ncbi:MAG: serine/threonine protein kinase, partial [Gemmataceae bacterium]